MDYFKRRGLRERSRVLEVGCGWGLSGIYCAKTHGAAVTGIDIDPEVFPFLHLQAAINGVEITTFKKGFNGLRKEHLKGIDVLIGADICFWTETIRAGRPLSGLGSISSRTGKPMCSIGPHADRDASKGAF
jgi:predicted nicotinamide N-methyase